MKHATALIIRQRIAADQRTTLYYRTAYVGPVHSYLLISDSIENPKPSPGSSNTLYLESLKNLMSVPGRDESGRMQKQDHTKCRYISRESGILRTSIRPRTDHVILNLEKFKYT
jgi:hypothetical protein